MLKREEKQKFANSKYSFDFIKASKIFDVLLKDKQIVLSGNHKIPHLLIYQFLMNKKI